MRPPHPNSPGLALGVDEDLIHRLVGDFYASIQEDPLLGPIFDARIEDWPEHLEKLAGFWSSVVLMTGQYKGAPFEAHLGLGRLGPEHFQRWLMLFADALARQCTPEQSELFMERAGRIAMNFQMGLAQYHGAHLGHLDAVS